MKKKKQTKITEVILEVLDAAAETVPRPFESPYAWVKRAGGVERKKYTDAVRYLEKKGSLKVVEKNNRRFLKITRKGQVELLLKKARTKRKSKWDGKWRIVIFDIPEASRKKRDQLRYLLRQNGFKKVQASVFISPNPVNREGVEYLKKSHLIHYIRFFRADAVDSDKDLKALFGLK